MHFGAARNSADIRSFLSRPVTVPMANGDRSPIGLEKL